MTNIKPGTMVKFAKHQDLDAVTVVAGPFKSGQGDRVVIQAPSGNHGFPLVSSLVAVSASNATYLVVDGAYSDYRVLTSFAAKEDAEAYALALREGVEEDYDGPRVESVTVKSPGELPVPELVKFTYVSPRTGEVTHSSERTDFLDDGEDGRPRTHKRDTRDGIYIVTSGRSDLVPQAHSDAIAKTRAEIIGL